MHGIQTSKLVNVFPKIINNFSLTRHISLDEDEDDDENNNNNFL